jgi:NAD(P)-dependent dehydrogenase (short-subunit alcohol dehydrogenase family)
MAAFQSSRGGLAVAEKPLSGKTALITGASRGIGRATALRLAQDGARVAVHGSRGAEDTARAVEQAGGHAVSLAGDLASLAGVDAVAVEFKNRLGRPAPDILVNNAGIQAGPSDTSARLTEADFDRLIDVNVKAPFFLVQRFLDDYPQGGRVINLSSRLSLIAFPDQIIYSATKAAINSFTKSLAKELGPRGITVNAVGPGPIETDMTRERLFTKPETRAAMAALAAVKRTGVPEDIADIVGFLASEDSRWITGAYFDASGGATL